MQKKRASRLEGRDSLEGFQISIHIWVKYIQQVMFERFVQRSQSDTENRN
jgi:hypothetical protein